MKHTARLPLAPKLQNIPLRTKVGKQIHEAFYGPRDESVTSSLRTTDFFIFCDDETSEAGTQADFYKIELRMYLSKK